eukprot:3571883-Karenia_brevis.AAC.1
MQLVVGRVPCRASISAKHASWIDASVALKNIVWALWSGGCKHMALSAAWSLDIGLRLLSMWACCSPVLHIAGLCNIGLR